MCIVRAEISNVSIDHGSIVRQFQSREYTKTFIFLCNFWFLGNDPERVYRQINEAIRGVFVSKYPQLVSALQRHENKR